MDVLEELQNAYNSIAGVDSKILHPRDKFQLYMKMDYAYRLLEELDDLSEYEEIVKKIREICRKKYIESVGRRKFKREVNVLLDRLLFSASKKSKKWGQAKKAIYLVSIGYVIPAIVALPVVFLLIPDRALSFVPMIGGFILGVFMIGIAAVNYPSRTNLMVLFFIGPFAVYVDLILLMTRITYLFVAILASLALIGVGLYYLLKNRFLFS